MLKKLFIGILTLTLLEGCKSIHSDSSSVSTNSAIVLENQAEDINDEVIQYLQQEDLVSDTTYLGEGMHPVIVDDLKDIKDSEIVIYPVFEEDDVIAFVKDDKSNYEYVLFNSDNKLENEVVLLEVNASIYVSDEKNLYVLFGEDLSEAEKDNMIKKLDVFEWKNTQLSKKLQVEKKKSEPVNDNHNQDGNETSPDNDAGTENHQTETQQPEITVEPETNDSDVTFVNGSEYSSKLLVVTFLNKNENNVAKFEQDSKGKLKRTLNDGKIYVFEIEPLYGDDLFVFAKMMERLDYVDTVNLSEVAHPTDAAVQS